jgi:hypothetical protein
MKNLDQPYKRLDKRHRSVLQVSRAQKSELVNQEGLLTKAIFASSRFTSFLVCYKFYKMTLYTIYHRLYTCRYVAPRYRESGSSISNKLHF